MGKPTLSLETLLAASREVPRDARLDLAVDPGAKTGIVLAVFGPLSVRPGVLVQEEPPMELFVDWAWELLHGETCCRRPDRVICEDYDITPATLRKSRGENWSLEQIGLLRQICRREGIEFVTQRPMQVIPLVTDERLAAFGLNKRGGDGHWRDAARHLLYRLAKDGRIDLPV